MRRTGSNIGRPFCFRGDIIAAGLLIASLGCQSFSKRPDSPDSPRSPATQGNEPFWDSGNAGRRPAANPPLAASPGNAGPYVGTNDSTGMIAGRVVDPSSRSVGVATVHVVSADGSGEAPRDIETTSQGFFMIRGLAPGRSYRLVAKSKQDGKPLGGQEIVRPPDARVLITVSADFAVSNPAERAPAELGAPRPGSDYQPPAAPEFIAGNDPAAMPRANIPGFGLPDTTPAIPFTPPHVSGPVPDCLVGNGRVLTLRLADPDGRTWDFSQRQGRLVLIDLWGSWCTPCLRAIPELTRLQQQYRTQGLEVIGIACENGHAGENLARVQAARRRMPYINYRLLIAGEPGTDPVRAQFHPTAYPSLLLLDADGSILWRGVGGNAIGEVEPIIRQRLSGPR